jgi:hypothetical protein
MDANPCGLSLVQNTVFYGYFVLDVHFTTNPENRSIALTLDRQGAPYGG